MKQFKKLTFALAASTAMLATSGCAQQQLPTPQSTTMVAAETREMVGPALWKVADEDTTIWMFGTVHALPDDVNWNAGAVKDALAGSDILVTEVDMTPEILAALPPKALALATLPTGTTLRSLFDDDQRMKYEAGMTKLGIPVEAFDQFEPWFAALSAYQVTMMKAGITGENGVEIVLEATMPETMKRGALETAEFQLEMFDGMPQDMQIEYLISTMEGIDEIGPMLNTIIEAWAKGDVDTVVDMLDDSMVEDALFLERLLYTRNANWADWIDTRLDTPGTVFMAVGAAHLAGEKSVQDYLNTRGIKSYRVQ
ncbi:hypothetical protein HME9302_01097 [Alteripontixanthobacter maritimus]|uniref:TraB/GumN family protein n=1 Tax=Alteripontixanthobacter maritimus TaxID=2161824 RepID=A0A369Q643_9SPHN|nr:TraB/GumN family protein [Alteripontixanthobacter maritimus]RDC59900.1 hypothetical protein HME9302_01097 [Alteripontixanthobacter maritimus]